MSTTSALLHPVRLRIVQTLLAKGTSTTRDLHERLGDIPIATLYRHIAYLSEHGLIEVDHERQVRGGEREVVPSHGRAGQSHGGRTRGVVVGGTARRVHGLRVGDDPGLRGLPR
ncbi:helix-turn-helix domain-containing protein [Microbacterium oxydans]|uniref:helix-turn-helix domain-containing protein n=1 Tax=Microbacterium oxydans TaxID=82380 RepID=UPI003D803A17